MVQSSQTVSASGTIGQAGSMALGSPTGLINNIHVVTWDTNTNLGSIPWDVLNSLSIFHVVPDSSGGISYDSGDIIGIQNCINTAHANGAKCLLTVGGAGVPIATINAIIGSTSVQNTLIANLLKEVATKGYDGIESDFEPVDSAHQFSGSQYTAFIQNLYTKMKAANSSYILAVCIASWMNASVVPQNIEPYVDALMTMTSYGTTSLSSFQSSVNQDAALLANPKKLIVGMDIDTTDPTFPVPTPAVGLSMMQWAIAQGYGLFIWVSSKLTSTWIANIRTAISGG